MLRILLLLNTLFPIINKRYPSFFLSLDIIIKMIHKELTTSNTNNVNLCRKIFKVLEYAINFQYNNIVNQARKTAFSPIRQTEK